MSYLLGIDIGTSGTKTILIKEDGSISATAFADYQLIYPKPGWAEQNTEDWWVATKKTIKECLRKSRIKPGDIKGIGLSGQMHGSVFLDKNNKVLYPAILWCDQRTYKECDEITKKVGAKKLTKWVCNPALTGFTAPKILWFRKNEPELYDKIAKILLPKDYIRFKLTGEFASEVSDASGTLLFDVKNRKWSDNILSALKIDKKLLPVVFESHIVSGEITDKAADETGLAKGTPVVGGGGDQAAGAVGNGVVKTGIISSTIGTSGVVFAFTDKIKTDEKQRIHSFCHAVPCKWHIMGVMLSAGGSFQWFRNNLADVEKDEAAKKGIDTYEILTKKASLPPVGSEGLIFLPYLMGERTPHADPHARGVFFGISMRHTKGHLIRAIMEGVTYGLRDSLEIIREMDIPIKQIRASGGGARSKLWRQIQADVFNTEIVTINFEEGPAFGVAILAGVGAKVYKNVSEACDSIIKVSSRIEPIKENVKIYNDYYPIYKSLYKDLKHEFSNLAEKVK